jgi:hypothetical protein
MVFLLLRETEPWQEVLAVEGHFLGVVQGGIPKAFSSV